jgi:hypothetical protein
MAQFLRYTDYGTTLVFGEAGNHHFLAMRVSSSTQIEFRKLKFFKFKGITYCNIFWWNC